MSLFEDIPPLDQAFDEYIARGDYCVTVHHDSERGHVWLEGAPGFPGRRRNDRPEDRLVIAEAPQGFADAQSDDERLGELAMRRIAAALYLVRAIPTADLLRMAQREGAEF